MSAPMPRVPPVTTAVRPSREKYLSRALLAILYLVLVQLCPGVWMLYQVMLLLI